MITLNNTYKKSEINCLTGSIRRNDAEYLCIKVQKNLIEFVNGKVHVRVQDKVELEVKKTLSSLYFPVLINLLQIKKKYIK